MSLIRAVSSTLNVPVGDDGRFYEMGANTGDKVALVASAIFNGYQVGNGPAQVLGFSVLTLGGLLLANDLSKKMATKLHFAHSYIALPARALSVFLTGAAAGMTFSKAVMNGSIALVTLYSGKKIGGALGGFTQFLSR